MKDVIYMFDTDFAAHLAELSKLNFSNDELEKIAVQMNDIIAIMDKVKEINSSLTPYSAEAVEYKNLRKDTIEPSFETDKILKNAKKKKDSSFVVPKIV